MNSICTESSCLKFIITKLLIYVTSALQNAAKSNLFKQDLWITTQYTQDYKTQISWSLKVGKALLLANVGAVNREMEVLSSRLEFNQKQGNGT